ncbi:MAG TPA: DUF2061 domain-containing protein [Patescibacteria group bacterium]|nr:DUF2061 domain-containing protein [Patescibacteria group bacterium]
MPKNFQENQARSLAKSATFRVLVVLSDMIIIYAVTRRLETTIALTVITNIASTVLYFLHERAWNAVRWGRQDDQNARPPL